MGFGAVVGQERAIERLKRNFSTGRVSHAYLFYGPEGVGKEVVARNFAKLLNCLSPKEGESCDYCESCTRIEKNTHPDVIWLRPKGPARTIPIGEPPNPERNSIRALLRAISLKSCLDRWKIAILCEAHTMRREAASALLKTLEEPPPRTILILITSRPEMLLPTVISRCQAVRFEPMREKVLEDLLRRGYSCSEADAREVSLLSEGRLGEAVRALRSGRLEHFREMASALGEWTDDYWRYLAGLMRRAEESLKRAEESLEWELAEKGLLAGENEDEEGEQQIRALKAGEIRRAQEEILRFILLWYRDLFVWKLTSSGELLIGPASEGGVARLAREFEEEDIHLALRKIDAALRLLKGNADFHTVLENLLVQLVSGRHGAGRG